MRLAVLASGRGSNLQTLIDARREGRLDIDLVAVGSDRPSCLALHRAAADGIDGFALRPRDYVDRNAFDRALFEQLLGYQPDLIVLAGYMRIIGVETVEQCPVPMLNIHPSLLPNYPGLDTHARALAAGDHIHGASVHVVIPALDAGPVIAQARIEIRLDDTPETLAARLLPREHALLLACLRLFAAGRITILPASIQFDGTRLAAPLQLESDDELHARPNHPDPG
jgi:phosphoribosylglycinamide formyltransferase 1